MPTKKPLSEEAAFLVVRSSGETSNQLFEVLEDWEEQLKHVDIDFGGPQL